VKTFDPDKIQKRIDEITVEEFGRLLARVIKEHPSSSNWSLVNQAIEMVTGWDAEHLQVRALIDRMSQ